ncbi:hypothetical protein J6590_011501 [Homalodisca vitripennis]|nr:hypothetical protein J6590_011501 [Homalodisca vitripennis]
MIRNKNQPKHTTKIVKQHKENNNEFLIKQIPCRRPDVTLAFFRSDMADIVPATPPSGDVIWDRNRWGPLPPILTNPEYLPAPEVAQRPFL